MIPPALRAELQRIFTKSWLDLASATTAQAAVSLLNWIGRLAAQQAEAAGAQHSEMVRRLLELGIVRPWITASVCPVCKAQDVCLSTIPRSRKNCGWCQRRWYSGEVYLFSRPFEFVKSRQWDLPLFISAYIRQLAIGANRIEPEACYDIGGERVQVDVGLPDLKLGIECKVLAVSTNVPNAKLKSLAGEIAKQASGYKRAGFERFLVCTNLNAEMASRLEEGLKESLAKRSHRPEEVTVLPGDLAALLQHLDKVVKMETARSERAMAHQISARISRESCSPSDDSSTSPRPSS